MWSNRLLIITRNTQVWPRRAPSKDKRQVLAQGKDEVIYSMFVKSAPTMTVAETPQRVSRQ
jgi:hypothetical protein